MKGCIIIADGFDAGEGCLLASALRRAGLEAELVGVGSTMISSERGITVRADRRFDGSLGNCDFVIITGGRSYEALSHTASVLSEIKRMHASGKLVAGISTGPVVLAKAGVLDEHEAVCYPGYEKEIPRPRNGRVKVDGNVITASGPGHAIEFALAIVNWFDPQKAAKLKRDMLIRTF